MQIWSRILRKKIYVFCCYSRFFSYRIRKSLCFILSQMEFEKMNDESVSSKEFIQPLKSIKSSKFEIKVLNNGTSETSSVFLDTGAYSYIFNCGENFQRLSNEFGCRINRLSSIFLTNNSWQYTGGIVSVLLNLKNYGRSKICLFGLPGLEDMISKIQHNFLAETLHLRVVTDFPERTYDDGIVKIKFVPIYRNQTKTKPRSKSESRVDEDKPKVEKNEANCSKKGRSHSEERKYNSVFEKYVLNFICFAGDFEHHLDFEACVKRKVPIGPLLRDLKSKKDITLENGDIVHWRDVCYTSNQGSNIFIFVDCPSIEYLDSLVKEEKYVPYQKSDKTPANLIIHFTPPEVMNNAKYLKWMSLFSSSTKHLIVNRDNKNFDLFRIYDIQKKMNFLSQNIFPSLYDAGLPVMNEAHSKSFWKLNFNLYICQDEEKEKKIIIPPLVHMASSREALTSELDIFRDIKGINVVHAIPSLTFSYHPSTPYEWSFNACYHSNTILENICLNPNMKSLLKNFNAFEEEWIKSDECLKKQEYPKIIFLGTGSGKPSIYRSTTGILVYLNENEIILLDCGEGTYMQILRLFGPKNTEELLKKIILIFISHHHADHHIGLITLLHKRHLLLSEKERIQNSLLILLPSTLTPWITLMKSVNRFISKDLMIVYTNKFTLEYLRVKEKLKNTELEDLFVCRVPHCFNACGISLIHKNGYKITYSGDCQPSESLAKMGKNSDILIHEATFEDDLEKMAFKKKHSTVSQAIEIGMKMNAKYILLTHFSQRYSYIPLVDFEFLPKNVAVAFDHMVVNERLLPLMEKMIPLYKEFFKREIGILQKKGDIKRRLKYETEDEETQEIDDFAPSKLQKTIDLF